MSKKETGRGEEDEMAATHWEFDVDRESPEIGVIEVIADLEGRESTDLPALYDTIDGVIEKLFSDPPSAEAQVRIEFTYAGYRLVLNQDGHATFMKIADGG